jgi:hypothetical protein
MPIDPETATSPALPAAPRAGCLAAARRMALPLGAVLATALAGCAFDPRGAALHDDDPPEPGTGPDGGPEPTAPDGAPDDPEPVNLLECRVPREMIGADDVVVQVRLKVVRVEEWRTGIDGRIVGFLLSSDAQSLRYRVEHRDDRFEVRGVEWLHPDAAAGERAPALTRIDFCRDDDD